MGRPRKTYFGEAEEDGERSGLLSAGSQDPITTETMSNPASPKGRYQGLGRTLTPHSLSAPAGLSSAAWEEEEEGVGDEAVTDPETADTKEPAEADLIVIT